MLHGGHVPDTHTPHTKSQHPAYLRPCIHSGVFLPFPSFFSSFRKTLHDWIPLYINEKHFAKARPLLAETLQRLVGYRGGADSTHFGVAALGVLVKLMNSTVVAIMKGEAHASSTLLKGYCQFHRLLLHFVINDAEVRKLVQRRIHGFLATPSAREKRVCPNLGEWLVLLSVCPTVTWVQASAAYLAESQARNVRWFLGDYPEMGNTEADPQVDATREEKVFAATDVSRSLLCFQVFFIRHLAPRAVEGGADACDADVVASLVERAGRYDRRAGLPSVRVEEGLQQAWKSIRSDLKSWDAYFGWLGLEVRGRRDTANASLLCCAWCVVCVTAVLELMDNMSTLLAYTSYLYRDAH